MNASVPIRILVVEDDINLRHMLITYFDGQGIASATATNRTEALRRLSTSTFSLILLDIRLGNDDGFELLQEIRKRLDIPIIIMTGHRRDESDKIAGLEFGADNYITKPFSLREMLAQVRAVVRRRELDRLAAERNRKAGGYRFKGWDVNLSFRRLTKPNGEQVRVSRGEFDLLVAFLNSPGLPLTREKLLQVMRAHEDIVDRSIDVHIMRLRKKLESDPNSIVEIETERSIGYRFSAPVERY